METKSRTHKAVKRLKIFKHLDSDKRDKCQIYVFELLGLSYAFIYLLYENTFDVIFNANNYADIDPVESLNLVRSLSSLVFLMYLVCDCVCACHMNK